MCVGGGEINCLPSTKEVGLMYTEGSLGFADSAVLISDVPIRFTACDFHVTAHKQRKPGQTCMHHRTSRRAENERASKKVRERENEPIVVQKHPCKEKSTGPLVHL